MASIKKRPNGQWRARYRDDSGHEYAKHFARKADAQQWLDQQTAALESGTHVSPRHDKLTVAEWCDQWLENYSPDAESSKRQAAVDLKRIKAGLGERQLRALRPMHVQKWLAELKTSGRSDGGPLEDSTVYATWRRLVQVLRAAVKNGRLGSLERALPEKPPSMGKTRMYVAELEDIWALYDAFPEHLRLAVLLGAYAGLRNGELCGLERTDVNPLLCEVTPRQQYGGKALKTEGSADTVPIPKWLAEMVTQHIADGYAGETYLLRNEWGDQAAPWLLQRAMRRARKQVPGLPANFRLHDCRHYLGSTLLEKGVDVATAQKQMRHASSATTLRVYTHAKKSAADKVRAALDDEFRPTPEKQKTEGA